MQYKNKFDNILIYRRNGKYRILYIYKVAQALYSGLEKPIIIKILKDDNINSDFAELIFNAGKILEHDWEMLDFDDEPTKPD
jgi:hypothetical protein